MESPTLLIVTNKSDPHADEVIRILSDKETIRPIRLNSDEFFSNCSYAFSWDTDGEVTGHYISILDSGIATDKVKVAWWRKPAPLQPAPGLVHPEAIEMALREGNILFRGIGTPFNGLVWVNDPHAMHVASPKLQQIRVARDCGLSIPETLVTNVNSELIRFVKDHGRCIVKPMSAGAFIFEGRSFGVFTSKVTLSQITELLDSVEYAPIMVQREIEKHQELRITFIGEEVFACAIDSSESELDDVRTDWRSIEPHHLPHQLVPIPDRLNNALRAMLSHYGLHYGAFDVIQEPDGHYYFLELNPNGQYLWIERLTGAKMSEAMVRLIEELAGTG